MPHIILMLYAVIPFSPTQAFSKNLAEVEAQVYMDYGPQLYFVSYKGTTRELAKALGFEDSSAGEGVVLSIANYWGLASKDLWEWIELRKNGE